MIVTQRLRTGSCGSPPGANRLVADALKVLGEFPSTSNLRPLVRADSAFYGCEVVNAAPCGGADASVTARLDKRVKATIATIAEDAWTTIDWWICDRSPNGWRGAGIALGQLQLQLQPSASWRDPASARAGWVRD